MWTIGLMCVENKTPSQRERQTWPMGNGQALREKSGLLHVILGYVSEQHFHFFVTALGSFFSSLKELSIAFLKRHWKFRHLEEPNEKTELFPISTSVATMGSSNGMASILARSRWEPSSNRCRWKSSVTEHWLAPLIEARWKEKRTNNKWVSLLFSVPLAPNRPDILQRVSHWGELMSKLKRDLYSKQLQKAGTGSQTNIIITLIFCITNTFWESYGYLYVTKISLYRLGGKKYHYSLSSIIKQVLLQPPSETHQMFFSILLPFMKIQFHFTSLIKISLLVSSGCIISKKYYV